MNFNSDSPRFFFEEVCFVCLAKLRVVDPAKTLFCRPTSYRFKVCDKFCSEVYRGFADKCSLVFDAESEVDKMLKDKNKKANKTLVKKIAQSVEYGRNFGNVYAIVLEFLAYFGLGNGNLVNRDVLFRCLKELARCMSQNRRFQHARQFLSIIKTNYSFNTADTLWLELDLVAVDLDIGLADVSLAALSNMVVPRSDIPNMRKSLELKMRSLIALEHDEKALVVLKSVPVVLPDWNKYNGSEYEAAELVYFSGRMLSICVQMKQSWEVASPYVAVVMTLAQKRHCKCEECICNYSSALHFLIASIIHYGMLQFSSEAVTYYNSVFRDSECNPNVDVIVQFSYVMGMMNQFLGKFERAVEFFMNAVAEIKHRYICQHYLYKACLQSLTVCIEESSRCSS